MQHTHMLAILQNTVNIVSQELDIETIRYIRKRMAKQR